MPSNRVHTASRRLCIALLLALPAALASAGVAEQIGGWFGAGPKSRLSVVLVDTSASVVGEDWLIYERALKALLDSSRPGDRVVIAAVTDRPASRFVPLADHRFEATGNSMQDEVRGRRTRKALEADFTTLRSMPAKPSAGTYLIDAIAASGELFAQAAKAGQTLQLLVLSDMIEESPVANFAREPLNEAMVRRVIENQRRRGLLADLQGVQVQVAGASGRTAAHMASVRGFWQAYFKAAGARVDGYGRTPGEIGR